MITNADLRDFETLTRDLGMASFLGNMGTITPGSIPFNLKNAVEWQLFHSIQAIQDLPNLDQADPVAACAVMDYAFITAALRDAGWFSDIGGIVAAAEELSSSLIDCGTSWNKPDEYVSVVWKRELLHERTPFALVTSTDWKTDDIVEGEESKAIRALIEQRHGGQIHRIARHSVLIPDYAAHVADRCVGMKRQMTGLGHLTPRMLSAA